MRIGKTLLKKKCMPIITSDTGQVLVFRSNIDHPAKADFVKAELLKNNKVYHTNVDLDDWENVLRVECHPALQAAILEELIRKLGFTCSELPD